MTFRRHRLTSIASLAGLVLGLILLLPRHASAASGITLFDARCTDAGVVVHFIYVEDPLDPTGHPEWTQYALMATSPMVPLPDCVGGTSGGVIGYFPRSGGTDDITYLFPHQDWLSGRYHRFTLHAQDANYNEIFGLVYGSDRSGCPIATTPAAMGTIDQDLGSAVRMESCPCTAEGSLVVKEPWASQLRPYVGTAQVILLYGEVTCSSSECSLEMHHFELMSACPERPVSTRARSWGQVKMHYR